MPRQTDIEDEEIERRLGARSQGGFAIVHHDRIVPGFGQSGGNMWRVSRTSSSTIRTAFLG